MKKVDAKLIGADEIARQTRSFQFNVQTERFESQPGQFVPLSMPPSMGLEEKESSRVFSIGLVPRRIEPPAGHTTDR